jgi:hypothetical protein
MPSLIYFLSTLFQSSLCYLFVFVLDNSFENKKETWKSSAASCSKFTLIYSTSPLLHSTTYLYLSALYKKQHTPRPGHARPWSSARARPPQLTLTLPQKDIYWNYHLHPVTSSNPRHLNPFPSLPTIKPIILFYFRLLRLVIDPYHILSSRPRPEPRSLGQRRPIDDVIRFISRNIPASSPLSSSAPTIRPCF